MENEKKPNLTVQTEDGDLLSQEEAKELPSKKKVKKEEKPKKLLGQHPITGKDVYQE